MKKLITILAILIIPFSQETLAQNISNFSTIWYNTFSSSSGGFGRAILDSNDLVISGAHWPSWPSGTTDQLVTKINPMGNILFQTIRTPGGDHDSYSAVVKLQNGNYGFFGQQNAQGTQYFDGFYTEFNGLGNEVSFNFFSIPGSSSGSDMLSLPNGNRVYTGNHGGGQNYITLTDPYFNQLNYQTFNVGGWNNGQLGIDVINNYIYAIGSQSNTSTIQIAKYDFTLNYITTYIITNTEPILNYDIKMDGSDLLLCGFKLIGGNRFGTYYRMNSSGIITDSLIAQNNSEFTAIEKFQNQIVLAKSNLVGANSILNELVTYSSTNGLGVSHQLNGSSPFVPYDLVLNSDTLYAIGAQGQGYWIGVPAVEKVLINYCLPNTVSELVTQCDSYTWNTNGQTYTQSGLYTEVLSNQNGCDSTVTLNLTITNSNSNSEIVTECDSYIWSADGQTYTQSGQYTAVLTNVAGCDSTVTLDLTINLTPDNSITQNGASLTATQIGATYQWIDCDNFNAPITGEVNQVFFPSSTGNYAVEVTIGDCSSTSVCQLVDFTGIDEIESLISVYPNPTKDEVTLSIGAELLGKGFVLTDNAGRIILTDTFKSAEQKVNLSVFDNGVYYIRTDTESLVKIIKQ